MANPLQVSNLHGTLVLASSGSTSSGIANPSGELGIAIGTTVTTGNSLTSLNVPLKAIPATLIALVQMGSGTVSVTLDVSSTGGTPTFTSSKAVTVTATHGEPIWVGPVQTVASTVVDTNGVITVTPVTNVAAIKITNNSGVTLAASSLRLLVLTQQGPFNNSIDSHTADLYSNSGEVRDGSGTFLLNT